MEVTYVEMPGMFCFKPDPIDPLLGPRTYSPLPYADGEICEPCWLTVDPVWQEIYAYAGSATHDLAALRTVGSDGCPHGGGSDG